MSEGRQAAKHEFQPYTCHAWLRSLVVGRCHRGTDFRACRARSAREALEEIQTFSAAPSQGGCLTGPLFPGIGIEHLIYMIFFCYGSSYGY